MLYTKIFQSPYLRSLEPGDSIWSCGNSLHNVSSSHIFLLAEWLSTNSIKIDMVFCSGRRITLVPRYQKNPSNTRSPCSCIASKCSGRRSHRFYLPWLLQCIQFFHWHRAHLAASVIFYSCRTSSVQQALGEVVASQ